MTWATLSLSARRAWIEIPAGCWRDARRTVALRKESVDRNRLTLKTEASELLSLSARRAWIEIRRPRPKTLTKNVALRKESVDRNNSPGGDAYAGVVALRKESVDRNLAPCRGRPQGVPSLSARRAWIEILRAVLRERCQPGVALRKESVDRNGGDIEEAVLQQASLSARRAWIEMRTPFTTTWSTKSRSPQGERG